MKRGCESERDRYQRHTTTTTTKNDERRKGKIINWLRLLCKLERRLNHWMGSVVGVCSFVWWRVVRKIAMANEQRKSKITKNYAVLLSYFLSSVQSFSRNSCNFFSFRVLSLKACIYSYFSIDIQLFLAFFILYFSKAKTHRGGFF